MASIYPFVRFSIRVPIRPETRFAYRICYVPSLYFIESGSARVLYEDGAFIRLPAGTLFSLKPGISHTWEVDPDSPPFAFLCVFFEWSYRPKPMAKVTGDLLCLSAEKHDPEMLDEPLDTGIPECLTVDAHGYWKGLFEAVSTDYNVLHHENYPESLAINGHFQLLLHQLYQLARRKNDATDPRIAKIKAYMDMNAGGEYGDIDLWAETLGLSRGHFHALFSTHTGFTPKRYWNRRRIDKARNDLSGTNDSVTVIAERYGFSSVHAFTKLFRQTVGISPTDYRKQSRLI
ncbi:AraC family transcriptional regulator [Paenibacillus lignilyticus]|uniref:Helix-turn-helix transcriptional regulator n=1 Tax=Paenibacillus lignilyticus TaxID=1172615 RepID=A0ABS5CJ66_9BACL|nr:AraC family transcriptional regulator [Paenibacillus lignilyticus]MBP3965872.1 helix-turn-helix transcriptional regulator [Paenibacillus lignilyticus]